jgi:uncharacterized sporulation protein YeaH/YhbH (DUF444 family)
MRDRSGSMGEFETYITRVMSSWMVDFLRTQYRNVETVFISHDTVAQEVDQEAFFKLGASGGTKVSPAYQLALDMTQERYPVAEWNTYPFHFTDGDNMSPADNTACVDLTRQLLNRSRAMGYLEIRRDAPGNVSSLQKELLQLGDPKLLIRTIRSKEDIYPALRGVFSPQAVAAK